MPANVEYLTSLLNKKLHIHTSDSRMFVGDFKCTDNERNIILSQAFEYREPNPTAVRAAAQASDADADESAAKVKLNMTSRFLGLIVVPGQHITKIEVEEFDHQDPIVGV